MFITILLLIAYILWGIIFYKIFKCFWSLYSAPKPKAKTPTAETPSQATKLGDFETNTEVESSYKAIDENRDEPGGLDEPECQTERQKMAMGTEDMLQDVIKNGEKIQDQVEAELETVPATVNPNKALEDQYYDHPLSCYYIKSSHNTYLLGNQIIGNSTIEAYRHAISNKVRCLELDLHDGYNGPVVYHNWTLTSKINAVEVFKDIAANYQKDDLPLILDIEDHLSDFQRNYIKDEMLEIFQDVLYLQDRTELECLPSPNQLRGKIIFIVAKSKWGSFANICQKVVYKDEETFRNRKFYEVTSLSEHKFNGIMKSSLKTKIIDRFWGSSENARLDQFRETTTKRLIRIYPGANRQLSGNFNPVLALNAGCQLVALNVQTKDSHLAIYESLFRENGNTGFTLKPNICLNKGATTNKKKISIKVIKGSNLTTNKKLVYTYVSIRIEGVQDDRKINKTKSAKSGDGHNPKWNEDLKFDITSPELGYLLLQVKQKQYLGLHHYTIGMYAVPLTNIVEGVQTIPLQDQFLRNINANLLVEIHTEDLT